MIAATVSYDEYGQKKTRVVTKYFRQCLGEVTPSLSFLSTSAISHTIHDTVAASVAGRKGYTNQGQGGEAAGRLHTTMDTVWRGCGLRDASGEAKKKRLPLEMSC